MSKFTVDEVYQEIDRQAAASGLDPKLVRAFFIAENSADGVLNRTVINGATTSRAGARGVMQTMPKTEELLKTQGFLPKEWQYNPADLRGQVQAGVAAIKEKSARLKDKNDPFELAAMYNGSTSTWRNYRAGLIDQIPAETKDYFIKIGKALGVDPGSKGTRMENQPTPQQTERGYVPQPSPGGARSASTSTSSSTRSNIYDPVQLANTMSAGYDIIRAGGSVDTALTSVANAAAQRQLAEQDQMGQIIATGAATGQRVAAETAVDAAEAARRSNILSIAGINPNQAGNIAAQTMEKIIAGTVALEREGQEIDQRMAVGIFDNPLQWLVNQTRLPGLVGQYNAKVREQNRAIEQTKELQGLAATQISLGQATDADLITQKGVAKAAEAASQAQEKLNEARQAVAGNAIRDAQLALNIGDVKFRTNVTLTELTKQVMSENINMNERDAARAAEKIQVDQVNKWLKMIGSDVQFDSPTFKALPAKERDDLIANAGIGKIGRNLYDSVVAINGRGNYNKIAAEGDAAAVTWLKGTVARAQQMTEEELKVARTSAQYSGKVIKTEEFLKNNMDKLQRVYEAEAADMRTASDTNPMKIAYDVMLKDPGLANNAVTKFLRDYGPTAKNPIFTKVDEKLILDRFSADIAAGTMTSGQAAAELAAFYKGGSALQLQRTKYPLFGLDKPSNGYTVVIPKPGLFDRSGAGGTVDLTNQAAVEEFLIRNTAQMVRQGTRSSLFSAPVPDVDYAALR